ncbi:MAG: hypothetical protein WCA06_13505, partial [Terrimicrobiaceae bacterium]
MEAALSSWIACPNRREYRRTCETAGKSGKQIDISGRREHGLQRGAAAVGGAVADWRLRIAIPLFCGRQASLMQRQGLIP